MDKEIDLNEISLIIERNQYLGFDHCIEYTNDGKKTREIISKELFQIIEYMAKKLNLNKTK